MQQQGIHTIFKEGFLTYLSYGPSACLKNKRSEFNISKIIKGSPSTLEQAMKKVMKGAKMTMQNAILLQQEIQQLHTENTCQKQKQEGTRCFIQTGGSLNGAEWLQKAQEQEAIVQEA